MEVFNKFYFQVSNSVSSTVSQLSGVLPGNPVTREFETTAHIASAGPGLLWKIYKGYKRSTKQEASVFVFEKRQLEKWNKNDREFILESLRRGVQQLTKIRHPQVLTIEHPLEESRESLAFAAEPVFASLANVLGETTNMPQPANMSDYKFYDIEIKYGMLQISEGLAFLHNDVRLLHKNLCPETIIINSSGVWKLFGLDFCVHNSNPPNVEGNYPFQDYSPTLPDVCQPNLNYLAPECILSRCHSPASDMFSLGMLAYAIYSTEKQCISPVRDVQQFKSRVQQLKNLSPNKLQCIPSELREFAKLLLSPTPEVRPDAHQFIKIPFFEDVGIKTLTYLDSLLQWDNIQKSQFYKGLPTALSKLPHRVKLRRVLSCLVRDLGQPIMVPFILPSIFDIAKDCNKEEYCAYVLPNLKPLMKLTDPVQVLLIMLQRMELLLKLTPAEDIQLHVLPMLYRGLDSDSPQIHELCLSVLPTFAGLLDHSNVKNSLLPRIKRLCLSTSTLSVRVNCLLCIGNLLEHLDKWLVLDEVLPFLPQIPSREPAVLMGILGIYKIAMHHKKLGITKEIIASRVLPFLIPLCIENGLTLAQFSALTSLVKEMFQLVENEHRTKLEQLNSVKDEQTTLASNMSDIASDSKPGEVVDRSDRGSLEGFMSHSLNLRQKQHVAQPVKSLGSSQSAVGDVKVSNIAKNETKDLCKSLLDDWVAPVQPSETVFKSSTTSFASNNHLARENQSPATNNINWSQSSNITPHNPWRSSVGNMTSTSMDLNASNSNYNFNSVLNNTSNPWSSSQQRPALNQSSNNQNWSALDSLLPSNSGSSKLAMNQMMPSKPLMSPSSANNNNSRGNQLSKDEIMDLLS